MRHRRHSRKLGRTSAHRLAMYRNLVTSLLEHEKIETTHTKAMEVRRLADRMITLGKRGDLHARRRALRVIRGKDVAAKVFGELADRYRTRPGGYTRVFRTRQRVGDAAEMSIVELVEPLAEPVSKKKAGAGKTTLGRKKRAARKQASGGEKAPSGKKAGAGRTRASKKKVPSKARPVSKKKAARKKTSAKRSRAD